MKKKDLLPYLFQGAEQYKRVLLNKEFLFIGQGDSNTPYFILESLFLAENYMHLTGCKIVDGYSAVNFFELCLNKRLSLNMFTAIPEAFLKKDTFKSVFSLPYSAKMIGVSSGGGNQLYTEKLAGNVRSCMGFILGNKAPYYSPNTVLQTDIRDITADTHKILAVYGKPIGESAYPYIPVSTAKELRNKELRWPPDISAKIASKIP